MNHPSDDELADLVGNYEQVADSVSKIKTLYEKVNEPTAAVAAKDARPEAVPPVRSAGPSPL